MNIHLFEWGSTQIRNGSEGSLHGRQGKDTWEFPGSLVLGSASLPGPGSIPGQEVRGELISHKQHSTAKKRKQIVPKH